MRLEVPTGGLKWLENAIFVHPHFAKFPPTESQKFPPTGG